jgi:hypothetical protein
MPIMMLIARELDALLPIIIRWELEFLADEVTTCHSNTRMPYRMGVIEAMSQKRKKLQKGPQNCSVKGVEQR